MSQDIRIGVAACAGHMGRAIMAAAIAAAGVRLSAASQYAGHPAVGMDAGTLATGAPAGVSVLDDPVMLMKACDVAIDFSTPEATRRHLDAAAPATTPLVIGTTGLDGAGEAYIDTAADSLPILYAPNMSLGATLLAEFARRIAAALDSSYDIEVLGRQHRRKVDAPSGTALALARAAATGRGLDPARVGATPRDGYTGARPTDLIGMATAQGGDMLGEHSVIFAGAGERLELTHKPSNRQVYAAGAVRAAVWLTEQPPGRYGMADVLGLAGPS